MTLDSGNAKEVVGPEEGGQQQAQGSGAQGAGGRTCRAVGPRVGRNWMHLPSPGMGPQGVLPVPPGWEEEAGWRPGQSCFGFRLVTFPLMAGEWAFLLQGDGDSAFTFFLSIPLWLGT